MELFLLPRTSTPNCLLTGTSYGFIATVSPVVYEEIPFLLDDYQLLRVIFSGILWIPATLRLAPQMAPLGNSPHLFSIYPLTKLPNIQSCLKKKKRERKIKSNPSHHLLFQKLVVDGTAEFAVFKHLGEQTSLHWLFDWPEAPWWRVFIEVFWFSHFSGYQDLGISKRTKRTRVTQQSSS